jgi:putative DNA primase/helicase
VIPDKIPQALKLERRWVCWRYEWNGHRWAKILITTYGRHARSNDATTWTTFEAALDAYKKGGFDGIGFCLGQGWSGIDLDHCIENGAVIEGARGPLAQLPCYVEVSPSGTGVKAFGSAAGRSGGEWRFDTKSRTLWQGARFFAVTGHAVQGCGEATADITALLDEWFPPKTTEARRSTDAPDWLREGTSGRQRLILTDDEIVDRLLISPQREKFIRLCRGVLSDYDNDHSRADQGFFSLVMFHCGDIDQAERLYTKTKLYHAGRWARRSYRQATLNRAKAYHLEAL